MLSAKKRSSLKLRYPAGIAFFEGKLSEQDLVCFFSRLAEGTIKRCVKRAEKTLSLRILLDRKSEGTNLQSLYEMPIYFVGRLTK